MVSDPISKVYGCHATYTNVLLVGSTIGPLTRRPGGEEMGQRMLSRERRGERASYDTTQEILLHNIYYYTMYSTAEYPIRNLILNIVCYKPS